MGSDPPAVEPAKRRGAADRQRAPAVAGLGVRTPAHRQDGSRSPIRKRQAHSPEEKGSGETPGLSGEEGTTLVRGSPSQEGSIAWQAAEGVDMAGDKAGAGGEGSETRQEDSAVEADLRRRNLTHLSPLLPAPTGRLAICAAGRPVHARQPAEGNLHPLFGLESHNKYLSWVW